MDPQEISTLGGPVGCKKDKARKKPIVNLLSGVPLTCPVFHFLNDVFGALPCNFGLVSVGLEASNGGETGRGLFVWLALFSEIGPVDLGESGVGNRTWLLSVMMAFFGITV